MLKSGYSIDEYSGTVMRAALGFLSDYRDTGMLYYLNQVKTCVLVLSHFYNRQAIVDNLKQIECDLDIGGFVEEAYGDGRRNSETAC